MKILVVDDEYFARKALVKMLKESDEEGLTVDAAETGEEAVEYIKAEKPEVVFADIRMPEMDGLELAKFLKEEYPSINIVIVSGYGDFTYARTAIEYGVKEYILKPVKKAELYAFMDKLKEEVRHKKEQEIEQGLVRKKIESYDDLVTEAGLNSAVYSKSGMAEEQLLDLFPQRGQSLDFVVVLLQTQCRLEEEMKLWLKKSLEGYLSAGHIAFASNRYNNEFVAVRYYNTAGKAPGRRGPDLTQLHTELAKLIKDTEGAFDCMVTIGTSDVHSDINELSNAYFEAKHALNYRLLSGWMKIYEYPKTLARSKYDLKLDAEMEQALKIDLANGNADSAKRHLRKIFSGIKDDLFLSISSFQDVCSKIVSLLNCRIKDLNRTERGTEGICGYVEKVDLMEYRFLEDITDYLYRQIDRICGFIIAEKKDLDPSIVEDIKRFIEDNYCYDISLSGLAKHRYFVNGSYLSRIFKEETGVGFSNYLLDVRMRKAKNLLKDSTYSLSEIAGMVGYNDLSHFIKSFKSFYSETPGQYKNRKSPQ